jgi:hypothetical protein
LIVQAIAGKNSGLHCKSVFTLQKRVLQTDPEAPPVLYHRCGIQWIEVLEDEGPSVHWPHAAFALWRSWDKSHSSIVDVYGWRWFVSQVEAKMYASLSFILYHKEQFGSNPSLRRFLDIPTSPGEENRYEGIAAHCVFVDPTGRKFAVGVRDDGGSTGYFLVDEDGRQVSDIHKCPRLGTALRAEGQCKRKAAFRGIISHFGLNNGGTSPCQGCLYNLNIRWADGSVTQEPLKTFAEDAWDECVSYARKRHLLSRKGWKFLNGRRNQKRPGNDNPNRHSKKPRHY